LAYTFKREYERADNHDKYVESIESRDNITISNYKVEERQSPNFNFSETIDFTENNIRLEDDIISF
jgi:hypothetical protein